MYVARFSYDLLPKDRERAIDFIGREVRAAQKAGKEARLLIPLTRCHGGPALQFEISLESLDDFERFRHQGIGSEQATMDWMHDFSTLLLSPPSVEILRIGEPAE